MSVGALMAKKENSRIVQILEINCNNLLKQKAEGRPSTTTKRPYD